MNDRTAEDDQISSDSGARTLFAGARMYAGPDTSRLDYPVMPNNLIVSMEAAGIAVEPQEDYSKSIVGQGSKGSAGRCVVETLLKTPDQNGSEISRWRTQVVKGDGDLIIVSPSPSARDYKKLDQLTPIVVWGKGVGQGVLYSPATKMSAFMTNTDFAPTVAALSGVKLLGPTYGSSAIVQSTKGFDDQQIVQMSKQAAVQTKAELAVPAIASILAVLMLLSLPVPKSSPHRYGREIILAYASAVVVLIGVFLHSAAYLIVASLMFPFLISFTRLKRELWSADLAIYFISAFAFATILLDTVFNRCQITASSLLGYNLLEGARYYGVGNEAMGILIGATVIITGLLVPKKHGLWIGSAIWIFVAATLGIPAFGAKAGGLIVALVSLAAFIAANANLPASKSVKLAVVVGAPLAIGLFSLIAISHFEGSHVSQTIGQAKAHGSGVIWSVIARKAAMDAHLVFHSAWILVLIVAIVGLRLTYGRQHAEINGDPMRRSIWITGCASIAACLMLNDAGVVAAALCSVFPWSYLTSDSSLKLGLSFTSAEA